MVTSPTPSFKLHSGTFVRQSHLLKILPFSPATLWRHVKSGRFPKPIKVGERAVAWEADAVLAWIIMDAYKKELKRQVRKVLAEHGVAEAKAIRDAVEEFAVHAYAGKH